MFAPLSTWFSGRSKKQRRSQPKRRRPSLLSFERLEDRIAPVSDLSIFKTGPSEVIAGEEIFYDISVFNNGPDTVGNVTVTDTLPAGVVYLDNTFPGSCLKSGDTLTCGFVQLAPGGSFDFKIKVLVPADFLATKDVNANEVQTVTLSGAIPGDQFELHFFDQVTGFIAVTATATDVQTALESLSNIAPGDVAVTGSAGGPYTVTFQGALAAQNVPQLVGVGFGAVTVTIATTTQGNHGDDGSFVITNTATVSSGTDPDLSDNTDTVSTFVEDEADLLITKYVVPTGTVSSGDNSPNNPVYSTFLYTIQVDNLGPSAARNVVIRDTLLNSNELTIESCAFSVSQGGGAITQFTCTTGPVVTTQFGSDVGTFSTNFLQPFGFDVSDPMDPMPQGRLRASFRLRVDQDADVTNITRVFSDTVDPNPSNNLATVDITVVDDADLTVAKVSKPDDIVQAGDQFTYTITVENLGPIAARHVAFTDLAVSSQDFQVVTVMDDPNRTDSCVIVPGFGTLTKSSTIKCSLTDPLEALGNAEDPPPVPNTGRWVVTVVMQSDRTGDIDNTVRVFTEGRLVDPPPPGGSLDMVDGTTDPDLSNNLATDSIHVEEFADLAVTKTNTPDPTVPGQFIYTITVENLGPNSARHVAFTDVTASNADFQVVTVMDDPNRTDSCLIVPGFGTLTMSSTIKCSLTDPLEAVGNSLNPPPVPNTGRWVVKVVVQSDNPGNIENTVRAFTEGRLVGLVIVPGTPDPDLSNNVAKSSIQIVASANLAVTKDAPATINPGTEMTFTIEVSNVGPSAATNVVLEDFLPAGVRALLYTPDVGNCLAGVPGDALRPTTCNLGTLASGDSVSVVVDVITDNCLHDLDILFNDVAVHSDLLDADTSDNVFHSSTQVRQSSAGNVVAKAAKGKMQLTGDNFNNTIMIEGAPDAGADAFRIVPFGGTKINGQCRSVQLHGIKKGANIRMGRASDTVLFHGPFTLVGGLTVNLGMGNDRVEFNNGATVRGTTNINLEGGNDHTEVLGSFFDVFNLRTGTGDDVVHVQSTNMRGKTSIRNDGQNDLVEILSSKFDADVLLQGGAQVDTLDAGTSSVPNANLNVFLALLRILGYENVIS